MHTAGEIPQGSAVAQPWPKGGICQLRLLVRRCSEALPTLTDEYLVIGWKKWSDHNITVWSHRHKVRNTERRNRIMYVGAKYRNFWCELGVITRKQMKQKKYLSVLFGQRVTISQQCDGAVKTARWTPAYSPGHSHHFWAVSNLSYLTPCLKLVYNFTHIEGNSTQK